MEMLWQTGGGVGEGIGLSAHWMAGRLGGRVAVWLAQLVL